MKKLLISNVFVWCLLSAVCAQQTLPVVPLKTLAGSEVSSAVLADSSQYTVISFWATWCKPCMQELDALTEQYDSWQTETRSRVVAVAIDDARTLAGVSGVVQSRQWPFDIFLDTEQALKRALNITAIPYTIILNKQGQIVKRHPGYTPGSEEALARFLKKQKSR